MRNSNFPLPRCAAQLKTCTLFVPGRAVAAGLSQPLLELILPGKKTFQQQTSCTFQRESPVNVYRFRSVFAPSQLLHLFSDVNGLSDRCFVPLILALEVLIFSAKYRVALDNVHWKAMRSVTPTACAGYEQAHSGASPTHRPPAAAVCAQPRRPARPSASAR